MKPAISIFQKSTANQVISTAVLTTLTGMSFAVTAGQRYWIRAKILFNPDTEGYNLRVNRTGTATNEAGVLVYGNATAEILTFPTNTTRNDNATAAQQYLAEINLNYDCATDGVISLQMSQDTPAGNNLTVLAAFLEVQIV